MTGIFQWYLDYIELINVVIIFLSLGFAGIFQMVRKGNKKRILNRKTIILDTIILNRILFLLF